jgi:hypothetical protein
MHARATCSAVRASKLDARDKPGHDELQKVTK